MADLEILCAKAIDLPIYIPESEKLEHRLSAVKVQSFDIYMLKQFLADNWFS